MEEGEGLGTRLCGVCVCARACVCVCVRVSVCPSPVRCLVHRFLQNRGSSELQTWIGYELGCLDGKLRFWRGEAQESGRNGPAANVSVR